LKPLNTYSKLYSKTAYLGENVINLLKQKVAQNVAIILGHFIFTKNHNEPPKVAQLVKNAQPGHPELDCPQPLPTPSGMQSNQLMCIHSYRDHSIHRERERAREQPCARKNLFPE
jgi:hypothetical protein